MMWPESIANSPTAGKAQRRDCEESKENEIKKEKEEEPEGGLGSSGRAQKRINRSLHRAGASARCQLQ